MKRCGTIQLELEVANLLNEELLAHVARYKDFPLNLFEKPAACYTGEHMEFAPTLHLYSSRAYDYLRNTVCSVLQVWS
jgi:hypothetical protein